MSVEYKFRPGWSPDGSLVAITIGSRGQKRVRKKPVSIFDEEDDDDVPCPHCREKIKRKRQLLKQFEKSLKPHTNGLKK